MQKTAAKPGQRTIWNRMRENVGWDSKEYADANQRMRDADDHVRTVITAQQNGLFVPPNPKSLKDILKAARNNFSRKDYIKCIGDLSIFHKSMTDILNVLNAFDDDLTKEHRSFLLSSISPDSPNYDPEYAQYMHDLRQRMESIPLAGKKAYYSSDLIKEASIIDSMSNFFQRNKEMAAWEKRYPKRALELKRKTASILDLSENMLTKVLTSLKEMASYRATRKIDDWYNSAKKIISVANPYHARFVNYYNTDIKPLLGSQEFITTIKSEKEKPEVTNVYQSSKTELEPTEPTLSIIPDLVAPNTKEIIPAETILDRDLVSKLTKIEDAVSLEGSEPGIMRGKVRNVPIETPSTTAETDTSGSELPKKERLTSEQFDIINRDRVRRELADAAKAIAATDPVAAPAAVVVAPAPAPAVTPAAAAAAAAAVAPAPPRQLSRRDIREETRERQKQEDLAKLKKLRANSAFIESLEVLSNEHPVILAKYILKYAGLIQKSDNDTYNKLINIVKSIKV